jgi:transcription elongation factor S-II
VALEIEDNLCSKYKDKKSYADKARSLVFNLKDPKNPKLRGRLIEGDLTSWDVVTMEPKELASELKKEEREKTLKDNLAERRTDW